MEDTAIEAIMLSVCSAPDFKWATLPDIQATPMRFADGQAKVLGALWSFKGEATTADRIMQRAGMQASRCVDRLGAAFSPGLFLPRSRQLHKSPTSIGRIGKPCYNSIAGVIDPANPAPAWCPLGRVFIAHPSFPTPVFAAFPCLM